jgi:hypothetical protein
LGREQTAIRKEAEYTIKCAQRSEIHVVALGPLLFFSTETGDAWMLGIEDKLALCLVRDYETQPYTINESPTHYSIEWKAAYEMDGDLFHVAERSGSVRTIWGYPTQQIIDTIHHARGLDM